MEITSLLWEVTCHMGSCSVVTCHRAVVTFPPLPQQKLVLNLAILEETRLSWPVRYSTKQWSYSGPPQGSAHHRQAKRCQYCAVSVVDAQTLSLLIYLGALWWRTTAFDILLQNAPTFNISCAKAVSRLARQCFCWYVYPVSQKVHPFTARPHCLQCRALY